MAMNPTLASESIPVKSVIWTLKASAALSSENSITGRYVTKNCPILSSGSHCGAAPEDAGRPDHQYDEQQRENDRITEIAGDERHAEGLDQPDQKATRDRARDASHAADDDHGEADDLDPRAHIR